MQSRLRLPQIAGRPRFRHGWEKPPGIEGVPSIRESTNDIDVS
jgi:hypothetical protein